MRRGLMGANDVVYNISTNQDMIYRYSTCAVR